MKRRRRPLLIGLTGGIGCGKSAAAARFAALGVPVIDTDAIARELTMPGHPILAEIAAVFGPAVFSTDGALDRAALRRLVFADEAARARLEAILHPAIGAEVDARLSRLPSETPYVILVVPLLLERPGWRERVDRILVVDCPESLQKLRVMQRSGLTADEVAAIMATQADRATRLAAADDVIENDADFEHLAHEVERLDALYRRLA